MEMLLLVGWLQLQKYDETGTAVWPSTMPIELESGFTAPANFFEISGGDIIAVFHSLLSGINSNLYAQRYDAEGNAVWAEATQLAEGLTAFNRNYTGTQDGDVVYMGYFSAANNRFDSYLQRINPDGTIPWGINGVDFDVEGADNGATPTTLNAVYLDENGDFVWTEETMPVATFSANKGRVQYTMPVNNQSVAVFMEDKGEGEKIYAQNIVDEELSVDEFSNASFTYTNPVQNEITLNSIVAIEQAAIYNMLGQQVFNKTYNGTTKMNIDVQSWTPGIYIMQLKADNGTSKSIKLIKK